jgi:FKBP-type peptidyl-prolyl cis-trans isomerase 2
VNIVGINQGINPIIFDKQNTRRLFNTMRHAKIVTLIFFLVVFSVSLTAFAGEEQSKEKVLSQVTDGKTVKIHYTLTVEGKVIDSSKGRDPLKFTAGSGQLIPGFEKALQGMQVGDKKTFQVSPEEGYGSVNPEAFREIPKDQLPPEIKPEVGMTLYTKSMSGQSMPVQVMEVKEDVVVMNFNHPLAGKTLNFDVEIMEIL